MDDLIKRLQSRRAFNGNTTIKRDHEGAPWYEERQYVTDPLCAEAAAALADAHATIARLEALLGRYAAHVEQYEGVNFLDDFYHEYGILTLDEMAEIRGYAAALSPREGEG